MFCHVPSVIYECALWWWVIFRGVWMHPRSVYVKLWYDICLVNVAVCAIHVLHNSGRSPLQLCCLMWWYDLDMFCLSSWYFDSVYTSDCIDSLLNLHIAFPYYPLCLIMFPHTISFVLQHLYFSSLLLYPFTGLFKLSRISFLCGRYSR